METPQTVYDGAPPADEKPADDTKPTGDESSDVTDETKSDTTDVVDEKSDDTEKKDDAPPASTDGTTVPLAALQEQRDKRQSAERERDDLKSKLDATTKPAETTSVFDDEAKFRDELKSDFDAQLNNQRYNQSQFFVGREIGEEALAAKTETFKTLAAANPALNQQIANSMSPYHEMVKIVDQHGELDKMKDLDAYKAKIRAELKAEMEADTEKGETDKAKLRDSIPETLAGESSVGKRSSSEGFTQKPAEEVYN